MSGTGKNLKKTVPLALLAVAAIIAVLVLNFIIWQDNRSTQAQITSLNSETSRAQANTATIPLPPADLNARLAAAQSALSEAQNVLPADVDLKDIIDYMIDTAEVCGVEVLPVISEGLLAADAGQPYRAYAFTVSVNGSLKNTLEFMRGLQGSKFPTLNIMDCAIDKTETTDYTKPENTMKVTVTLSINVYMNSLAGEDSAS